MKHAIAATALVGLFVGCGLAACSTDDGSPPLMSSARAANPTEALYPPLQADAADGLVHEYY